MFVSIEGIEGSGKSTLLVGLAERLRAAAIPVVTTREPGGTVFGDRMRAAFVSSDAPVDPLAEVFALNASRAELVAEVVEPALRAGSWVLTDRFTTATLAYQGYGRGIDLAVLRVLSSIATCGVAPDRVLLLDVPVELSRARVAARAQASGAAIDRLESEDDAFHQRVRAGYLALAREDARIVVLDGRRPPSESLDEAWRALNAKAQA